MSFHHRKAKCESARCQRCDADLYARSSGFVHCSNRACPYFLNSKPHPTGPNLNSGRASTP